MHAASDNQILPLESCASGLIWSVSLLNRTHPYPGYGPVPLWLVQPPNPAMSTCERRNKHHSEMSIIGKKQQQQGGDGGNWLKETFRHKMLHKGSSLYH